ncbi:uncharacterized protein LOC143521749 [Brachyhypopomus gauderio]|uniref:uncharacterized protein LOC143521749 n=1 Tax=Brachyhypopomus gauderio TaxID=698409 RepID=UPI0040424C3A
MPGYATRPKRSQRPSRRHHASAPAQHRAATVTPELMEQDPLCSIMLLRSWEAKTVEMAEYFRQTAVRMWRERHPCPTRDLSPLRVGSLELCSTEKTPESEFEGEESEGEEEEEDQAPSVCSASTVDYGEEEDYPPFVCYAPTVDYGGGEGNEEDYPPSKCSAPAVGYGEEEEEEDYDYPPSECSAPAVVYGEEEEEEDDEYPPSECSAPAVGYDEEVEQSASL